MRTEVNSPFSPGADRVPQVWAGRELELADAAAFVARRAAGVHDRGRAILGEFGMGKSVLLNRIAGDLAAEGHWVAAPVRIPIGGDPVPLLANALRDLVAARSTDGALGRRADGLLDRLSSVTFPVVGGGVGLRPTGGDEAWTEVGRLLQHVARLAGEAGRLLVIRIDEVQNSDVHALSRLLTLLADAGEAATEEVDPTGIVRQRALPFVAWLSGLPDFRDRVAAAGSTFARRYRIHDLELLDEPALRTALHPFTAEGWPVLGPDGPVAILMEPAAVDRIVARCLGDPFLFQLAGDAAWNAGTGPLITEEEAHRGWTFVRREILRYVEGRLSRASDLQLDVLRAAASVEEDERTADAVARALGRTGSAAIGSTLQSLDRTHHLIRRDVGRVVFRSEAVRRYLIGDWP